jgi:hypothetical protein
MAVGVLINYHLNLFTMAKNEKTSNKVASTAGKLLQNPKTPKRVKKVAASALTQTADKKRR